MPEDLGITEVRIVDVQHRIVGVLRPGPTVVVAVREILDLLAVSVTGVNGDHRRLRAIAESGRILMVDHATAAERHDSVFFGNRQRQMFPVRQVATDGMSPTHVPPRIARGIVLVEEVVFAVVEDQSVGVVHPVDFGREMCLRTKRFVQVIGGPSVLGKLVLEAEVFDERVVGTNGSAAAQQTKQ